jgi:hypothetical protein
MPREWHPLRLFVDEDDRRHPTILFWLFFIPFMAIVVAGCYAVLNRTAEQTRVAAALTGTPALTAADTSTPAATSTPQPPTGEPTPTQYVYDDPSGWEFVERTDPSGTTYLDLQDWQREQVWHAFEEFWNLYNHNEGGLPDWEAIEPYIAGTFVDFVLGEYGRAEETGRYVYLVERLEDIPHRALVLESPEPGNVRVRAILVMERSYQVEYRDVDTGMILEDGKWLPYAAWEFTMAFQTDRWVVEEETHEVFQE